MRARIEAPTPRTGVVVGVHFEAGIGWTDEPAKVAFFERRGWSVAYEAEALEAEGIDPDTVPTLHEDGSVSHPAGPLHPDAAHVTPLDPAAVAAAAEVPEQVTPEEEGEATDVPNAPADDQTGDPADHGRDAAEVGQTPAESTDAEKAPAKAPAKAATRRKAS